MSFDLLQKGKGHAGSIDEYALQARLDAALGNGTIKFVLRGQIGFVALPTARGAANVPPVHYWLRSAWTGLHAVSATFTCTERSVRTCGLREG